MKIVVAIGGNMISNASNKNETFENSLERIKQTAQLLVNIIKQGHQVVVTHGNGPQVGSLLLQQQADVAGSVNLPLYILGALTQGQIGVTLQHALLNEIKQDNINQKVYVVPTTVIVSSEDPGFENPTKPVGPSYTDEDFANIDKKDYIYRRTSKGMRRVVASPIPMEIMEKELIADLIDQKHLVIAVGGGGSPTVNNGHLQLVDAVIDKDLASSLLARQINADMLMILTDVEGVYTDFGTENQKLIPQLGVEQAKELISDPNWGAGSIAPKIKAGIEFAELGKAIITSPEKAIDAINGNAGTTISK